MKPANLLPREPQLCFPHALCWPGAWFEVTAAALDAVFPAPISGIGSSIAQFRRVPDTGEDGGQVARRQATNCLLRTLHPLLNAWLTVALSPCERIGAAGGNLACIDAKDELSQLGGVELLCAACCKSAWVWKGKFLWVARVAFPWREMHPCWPSRLRSWS